MSERTRTGKIGSISISVEFIRKLGAVLEEEVKVRNNIAEQEIQQAIEKERLELEASSLYKTEEEKREELSIRSERIKNSKAPHLNLQYTVDSSEEQLAFNLAEELLATNFLPDDIKSFTCRVNHYAKDFVDVRISITKPTSMLFFGFLSSYNLSSSDEGKLLAKEKNLKSLFSEFQTSYGWLVYPTRKDFCFLVPFIISLFVPCGIIIIIMSNTEKEFVSNLIFPIIYFGYISVYFLIEYLFPYYSFEITPQNFLKRASFRSVFWALSLGVMGTAVYEILAKFVN